MTSQISRLLSVLYYEDLVSIEGIALSHLGNGLAPHHWISYLHQASIGTLFNNTLCARMINKFVYLCCRISYVDTFIIYLKDLPITIPLIPVCLRGTLGDMDSCNHVYRWDRKPYQLVFNLGFEARHQGNTQVETYFNLESYVNNGG
ncbi:hypothetical protein CTI12_AA529390 [Artemisia annua]|uniref:Uncharacterized protein n=1 Tax=Artemisia annua TaxID=35608 RepID=A0A2U1L534_ARTAN|nr:hypothetical protein CTI12_AA529390 [Artemisia annua]